MPDSNTQSVRFSIVITSHNQREFIVDAVTSAINQTIHAREVIVVDDGSTDGSQQQLQAFGSQIQLFCLSQNLGAIAARNYGASNAKGDYLVFLDGDDLLLPWALDVYAAVVRRERPAVVLGDTIWFTGSPPVIESIFDSVQFVAYDALLQKDRPVGLTASAYVVEAKAFHGVGGWTAGLFHLDLQDLSLKLGVLPTVIICSPATALYRIHQGNTILSVSPFLRNIHRLLAKERADEYPGGHGYRLKRRAWFGGLVVFWIKRALKAGLYLEALRLLTAGWSMIVLGIVRRCIAWIKGRKSVETTQINCETKHLVIAAPDS